MILELTLIAALQIAQPNDTALQQLPPEEVKYAVVLSDEIVLMKLKDIKARLKELKEANNKKDFDLEVALEITIGSIPSVCTDQQARANLCIKVN